MAVSAKDCRRGPSRLNTTTTLLAFGETANEIPSKNDSARPSGFVKGYDNRALSRIEILCAVNLVCRQVLDSECALEANQSVIEPRKAKAFHRRSQHLRKGMFRQAMSDTDCTFKFQCLLGGV